MSLAICFLVINEIKELPTLAINSVLAQTRAPIFIGYLRESDILDLPKSEQITLLKITDLPGQRISNYQKFGSNSFYDAVSKKWELIAEVLNQGFEFAIYNDIDLVWARDAGSEIVNTFLSNQETQILIQSLTESPATPSLCMGFIAMRNSTFTKNFIDDCATANLESRNRLEMMKL